MLDHLHIKLGRHTGHQNERGASAVEYGLLIAGIAALVAVVIFAFGGSVNGLLGPTCETLKNSSGNSQSC